jgi:uncharacterized protein (DUF302 family)
MKIAGLGSTCLIPVPYLSGLKLVRDALQNARFSILGEVDLFEGLGGDAGVTSHLCRVIYIDSPVLLFETLILDRAAEVFLPLHLLVRQDRRKTCVHWINPAAVFGARPPASAAIPLYELQTRVSEALLPLAGGLT